MHCARSSRRPAHDKNATPIARGSISFKNFVEDWKTNLTRKGDDVLEAKLRDKYIGMRTHDAEEEEEEEDGGYNEKRIIYDITWQAQRLKGYYALSGLIKEYGNVDRTGEARSNYHINALRHDLFTEAINPGFAFAAALS